MAEYTQGISTFENPNHWPPEGLLLFCASCISVVQVTAAPWSSGCAEAGKLHEWIRHQIKGVGVGWRHEGDHMAQLLLLKKCIIASDLSAS